MKRSKYSLTFDLWQTLISDEPDDDIVRGRMRCEGLQRVLADLGFVVRLDSLLDAHKESAPRLQERWSRNENVSTMDQIEMIVQLASSSAFALPRDSRSVEMLQNAYISPAFAFPPILKEDASSTLTGARERVQKIGLISNTGRTPGTALRKILNTMGILRFFDATVFSDGVGCRKPNRPIFEVALRELGSQPTNTIHVGDNPETDVWGAKQVGMQAILLEYPVPEELKRDAGSLFALSRSQRHVPDSEIKADAHIISLGEVLGFLDSLV
jgi:FMN phosphatase YigB (HAD superfamily)